MNFLYDNIYRLKSESIKEYEVFPREVTPTHFPLPPSLEAHIFYAKRLLSHLSPAYKHDFHAKRLSPFLRVHDFHAKTTSTLPTFSLTKAHDFTCEARSTWMKSRKIKFFFHFPKLKLCVFYFSHWGSMCKISS